MNEGGRPKFGKNASDEDEVSDHDAKGAIQTLIFTILPCRVGACRLNDLPCGIDNGSQLCVAPKSTTLVRTEEPGTVLKAVSSQKTFQDRDRW
jgi:hypothetical protein